MGRRQRLIERREQLGLSQADVAHLVGCTEDTISRYEVGRSKPPASRRRPLADAYQWTPEQLALAFADGPQPVNGHSVPGWLGLLASLEQTAAHLAAWEPFAVHGLLQTADYATAVERADVVERDASGVARRVKSRLARQSALHRENPLSLTVVLDEAVLGHVAGSREVMADQLDQLADAAEWPNVDLRVLPSGAGRFSAAFGAFSLLTQPGAVSPWMAVTEDRAGPHMHDADHAPSAVDAHVQLFDHLTTHSLNPDDSRDLIGRIAKEYR